MTSAHFIYIPSIFTVGVIAGWILGVRAAHEARAEGERRAAERETRRRARSALDEQPPSDKEPSDEARPLSKV